MGKVNKSLKLTPRKIRSIIRGKINNKSTKRIAAEEKLSPSTVKRVWMHYLRNREAVPIKKFGRPRKELESWKEDLILKVHNEQNFGARRLEKIIEFKHGGFEYRITPSMRSLQSMASPNRI